MKEQWLECRKVTTHTEIYLPLAMRSTLMARMIVGLMGINPDLISSRIIPIIDSMTIAISSRFQLQSTQKTRN